MTVQYVRIERHVEQVEDGRRYKGYVTIGSARFEYELAFGLPIADVLELEPTTDDSEFRRRFRITLRRGGEDIELTRREYAFFLELLSTFAVQFYENAQTRDANEGGLGAVIRGEGLFGVDGVSASISMTETETCGLLPVACKMLNQPKFGCAILSA